MTHRILHRRLFLTGLAAAGGAGLVATPHLVLAQAPAAPTAAPAAPAAAAPAPAAPPAFTLPPLGYAYEALEPFIDTMTMRIHHSAHHNAFIGNLNTLAGQWADLAKTPIDTILRDMSIVPDAQKAGVRNNLGGHWNHTYFWDIMAPGGA